jgi:hypothetical protein
MPPAGFEDRDDHRTACASVGALALATYSRNCHPRTKRWIFIVLANCNPSLRLE